MARWLRISLIALGALIVAAALVWQFYDPGSGYPISGVDVSHHQGQIDWPALAADDTSFAYIEPLRAEIGLIRDSSRTGERHASPA